MQSLSLIDVNEMFVGMERKSKVVSFNVELCAVFAVNKDDSGKLVVIVEKGMTLFSNDKFLPS
jgi:hypothetical protein